MQPKFTCQLQRNATHSNFIHRTWGNESLDERRTFSGFRSQCTIERGFACKYCSARRICTRDAQSHTRYSVTSAVYAASSTSSSFIKPRAKCPLECNACIMMTNIYTVLLDYVGYRFLHKCNSSAAFYFINHSLHSTVWPGLSFLLFDHHR